MEKLDDDQTFHYMKPMELFESKDLVKICAPMVRYSKQGFRTLVRKYGCDLTFTPMIISNSFVRSIRARDSDFTTNARDRPLIVQFAASTPTDFANATEIVAPFCDGVDLNCGCPQRWAMQEGYGACLLKHPELICDMVKQARSRVNNSDFTVSIKIRIHKDLKQTVDMCRQAEAAGASFITVHGRTKDERCQPVHMDAIRTVKDSVSCPVVANGDIRSLDDALRVRAETGVDGVMAARGILANPAMYAGYKSTPLQCVKDWVDMGLCVGTPFPCFHHHLIYMLEHTWCKPERTVFNSLASMSSVLNFLEENLDIS